MGSTEPLTELRHQLADARRRGKGFNECWAVTVRGVLRAVPQAKRKEWRDALEHTRSTWQRCFDREAATPAEEALVRAVGHIERDPLPDRWCGQCDGPLPAGTNAGREFCSKACANAATGVIDRGGAVGPRAVPDLPALEPEDWSADDQLELAA